MGKMKQREMFKELGFLIFLVAVVSIIFQLQIIREILFMFGGNEIVYGLVLALWLLAVGLGAWFSSFLNVSKRVLKALVCLELALPPFLIIGARLIKQYWILGVAKEFSFVILTSILILFPFCFLSGLVITKASRITSHEKTRRLVDFYFLDISGNLIGAILFFFFLITLNTIRTASLISLISLGIVWLVFYFYFSEKHLGKDLFFLGMFGIVLVLCIFSFLVNLDNLLLSNELGNLVAFKESRLGRIVIAESNYQRNYFYDSVPIGDNATQSEAEMLTHLPLSLVKGADNFLLLKSFFVNELEELSHYDSLNVTIVSPDKTLVKEIEKREFSEAEVELKEKGIKVVPIDPYLFLNTLLKEEHISYDAVVVGNPGIFSYRDNRLFTREFFRKAKDILSPKGVLVVPVKGGENFINEAKAITLSSVYNALKAEFSSVIYLPGETIYLLASSNPLSYSFFETLDSMNNSYANSMHLSPLLEERRMEMVNQSFSAAGIENRNLRPVSFYYSILDWFEQTGSRPIGIVLVLLGLSAFIICRFKWSEAPILTSGIISSSVQVILVILLSVSIGYGFLGMVLLTLFFMMGLWIGTLLAKRFFCGLKASLKGFAIVTEIILLFVLVVLAIISINLEFLNAYWHRFLLALIFGVDIIIGAGVAVQFSFIGNVRKVYSPRHAFSADSIGSFLGAFLFPLFLIPLLGVINVFFLLLGIKLISLIGVLLSKDV